MSSLLLIWKTFVIVRCLIFLLSQLDLSDSVFVRCIALVLSTYWLFSFQLIVWQLANGLNKPLRYIFVWTALFMKQFGIAGFLCLVWKSLTASKVCVANIAIAKLSLLMKPFCIDKLVIGPCGSRSFGCRIYWTCSFLEVALCCFQLHGD